MAAAQAGASLASDGVDLVHEHDAWRVLLGLVEEVADAAGADTDEHLDELGAGDREERHARLTGDGLAEQRLARAGRPDEQHALRDARPEGYELLRIFQELDDLGELLFGLNDTGDVSERDGPLFAGDQPSTRPPEAYRRLISP